MKKSVNKLQLQKIQVTRLHNLSMIKGGSFALNDNLNCDDDDDDSSITDTQRSHRV